MNFWCISILSKIYYKIIAIIIHLQITRLGPDQNFFPNSRSHKIQTMYIMLSRIAVNMETYFQSACHLKICTELYQSKKFFQNLLNWWPERNMYKGSKSRTSPIPHPELRTKCKHEYFASPTTGDLLKPLNSKRTTFTASKTWAKRQLMSLEISSGLTSLAIASSSVCH